MIIVVVVMCCCLVYLLTKSNCVCSSWALHVWFMLAVGEVTGRTRSLQGRIYNKMMVESSLYNSETCKLKKTS